MSQTQIRPTDTLVREIEALEARTWQPPYETYRTTRGTTWTFDLPGILPKNLHVQFRDGLLLVWGHRNATPTARLVEHASTLKTGSFAVELPVDETLDLSRAVQKFEDGVLSVTIPYRRPTLKRRVGGPDRV